MKRQLGAVGPLLVRWHTLKTRLGRTCLRGVSDIGVKNIHQPINIHLNFSPSATTFHFTRLLGFFGTHLEGFCDCLSHEPCAAAIRVLFYVFCSRICIHALFIRNQPKAKDRLLVSWESTIYNKVLPWKSVQNATNGMMLLVTWFFCCIWNVNPTKKKALLRPNGRDIFLPRARAVSC